MPIAPLLLSLAIAPAGPAQAQLLTQVPVAPVIALPGAPLAGPAASLPSTSLLPLLSPAPLSVSPVLRAPSALPSVEAGPALPLVKGAPVALPRSAEILGLRPTQFSAGMREVEEKAGKLGGMGPKEREKYLAEHPIPVAIGPGGALYVLDHHHLALAAWRSGIAELPVEVKADFSRLPERAFWEEMDRRHWIYPYDEHGGGPHDPSQLPRDVRGLKDDPYRSVAWQVRERGGFRKTDEFFIEFRWADFFRKNLKADPSEHFKHAVEEAMELARSPLARDLPGYLGPR